MAAPTDAWWRGAVIYQVYPRSFADGNGDGIGDLAGIRARLRLPARPRRRRDLVQPVVPVADGRRRLRRGRLPRHRPGLRHPGRGRGADRRGARARHPDHRRHRAQPLLRRSTRGSRRRWPAGPGSAARDLFWFRPGRGAHGELPPNDWQSIFGGPAWTRVTNRTAPGEWYLHLFAPEQPDFNWDNPEVREEFEDILRFWFDRGVDGIRIDSAALLVKDPTLPDFDPATRRCRTRSPTATRCTRSTGAGGGSPTRTPEPRALIGEVWLPDARAVRPLPAPGRAAHRVQLRLPRLRRGTPAALRDVHRRDAGRARAGRRARHLGAVQPRRHPARHPVRPGGHHVQLRHAPAPTAPRSTWSSAPAGPAPRRCCSLALPGAAYVYQGEELGLWEVEDIPDELRQDPMCSAPAGRPGPRRLPGAAAVVRRRAAVRVQPRRRRGALAAAAGRVEATARPQAQTGDPDSMLELYRGGAARCAAPSRRSATARLTWLRRARRGARLRPGRRASPAWSTCPTRRCRCRPTSAVLLASGPLDGRPAAPDTAVWLRTA